MSAARPTRPKARLLPLLALTFLAAAALRFADGPLSALAQDAARPEQAAAPLPADPREGAEWAIRLSEREAEITAREAEVAARLAEVSQIESRISEHLAALAQAEAELEATMALADRAAEGDLGRLVAMYENMRPEDAARLFSEMDEGFAAGFLARLRPEVAAAVLSGMEPQRAYLISAIVAGRNVEVPRR